MTKPKTPAAKSVAKPATKKIVITVKKDTPEKKIITISKKPAPSTDGKVNKLVVPTEPRQSKPQAAPAKKTVAKKVFVKKPATVQVAVKKNTATVAKEPRVTMAALFMKPTQPQNVVKEAPKPVAVPTPQVVNKRSDAISIKDFMSSINTNTTFKPRKF